LGRLADLPTLADQQATPRATPKPSTRLARAIAKTAARRTDAKQLADWARQVKDRDQWKDRRTGQRVRSTSQLDPLRAEAHHIVSKDDRAVRYDVRNGICLSLETHDLVERYVLRIEGTAWFTKHGQRYIDARSPVRFVKT
jgi:hypothetical protein